MGRDTDSAHAGQMDVVVPHPMGLPLRFYRFALTARETLVSAQPDRLCAVMRLTFALPDGNSLRFRPGLAEHVKVYLPWTRKAKSYSPTSPPNRVGSFDLVVKVYPEGKYSTHLAALSVGDAVLMSGPFPHPRIPMIRRTARALCIIAFGIGVTSALPLARAELASEEFAQVAILHANRYRDDDVLRGEVDALTQHGERMLVVRAYSREQVDGAREGRVATAMLQDVFQLDGGRDVVFHVVGSKPMIKSTWHMLAQLGYPRRKYTFLRKGVSGRSRAVGGDAGRSGRWSGRDGETSDDDWIQS
eukprot:IDg2626t1